MEIHFKNEILGSRYKVEIPLYNRGDCLAFDFDNHRKQFTLEKVTALEAAQMMIEIARYINDQKLTKPYEKMVRNLLKSENL